MENGIIFEEKPNNVPFNYRISYKVSLICLMIKKCGGKRACSITKLHIISDALMDENYFVRLVRFIKNPKDTDDFIIRYDQAINRAIAYAEGEGLIIQQANKSYKLTDIGRQFVKEICDDDKLLATEKERLERISVSLTEDMINTLMNRWSA